MIEIGSIVQVKPTHYPKVPMPHRHNFSIVIDKQGPMCVLAVHHVVTNNIMMGFGSTKVYSPGTFRNRTSLMDVHESYLEVVGEMLPEII